jgi:nicotinate-nucleotide adenylyltransferase
MEKINMANENLLLFGGTFNPIHLGHLITSRHVLETCKEKTKCNKITLLPNGNAPHKDNIIDASHRLEMCKLAIEDDENFEVCDHEATKTDPSYTFDTITSLKSQLNSADAQIYMIIGLDTFHELPTWHRIDELVHICNFIVMYDDSSKSIFQEFPMTPFYLNIWNNLYPFRHESLYSYMKTIQFVTVPRIDIRATSIRHRVKAGSSINYMVHPSVELYIINNGLYL